MTFDLKIALGHSLGAMWDLVLDGLMEILHELRMHPKQETEELTTLRERGEERGERENREREREGERERGEGGI